MVAADSFAGSARTVAPLNPTNAATIRRKVRTTHLTIGSSDVSPRSVPAASIASPTLPAKANRPCPVGGSAATMIANHHIGGPTRGRIHLRRHRRDDRPFVAATG